MADGNVQAELGEETDVAFEVGAVSPEDVSLADVPDSEGVEQRGRDAVGAVADGITIPFTDNPVGEPPDLRAKGLAGGQDGGLGGGDGGARHGGLLLAVRFARVALGAGAGTDIVGAARVSLRRPPARKRHAVGGRDLPAWAGLRAQPRRRDERRQGEREECCFSKVKTHGPGQLASPLRLLTRDDSETWNVVEVGGIVGDKRAIEQKSAHGLASSRSSLRRV